MTAPRRDGPAPSGRPDPDTPRPYSPRPYQFVSLACDVIAMAVAVLAGSILWRLAMDDTFASLTACVVLGLTWLAALALCGAYDSRRIGRGLREYQRVVAAGLITAGLMVTLAFLAHQHPSRGFATIVFSVGVCLMLVGRWATRRWLYHARQHGRQQRLVWVVGDRDQAAEASSILSSDGAFEYRVIGSSVEPQRVSDVPGWLDELLPRVLAADVDTVVVATAKLEPALMQAITWRLEGPGVNLLVTPVFGRLVGSRIRVHKTGGMPFLSLDEPRLIGPQRFVKRCIDIVGSVALIVAMSPVMIVAALMVRASGPGPILYVQHRVGQNGELFVFPKFRTMISGADRMRDEVIGMPDADITIRYRADPRITSAGRFLRRWSLDELPQLFSVLAGSMSLVGPRPMLPDEIRLLAGSDHRRHVAKPGLTGLWQVNGRKETTWEERMNLDLDYIDKWSPLLDLAIMVRTLAAVLSARGAY